MNVTEIITNKYIKYRNSKFDGNNYQQSKPFVHNQITSSVLWNASKCACNRCEDGIEISTHDRQSQFCHRFYIPIFSLDLKHFNYWIWDRIPQVKLELNSRDYYSDEGNRSKILECIKAMHYHSITDDDNNGIDYNNITDRELVLIAINTTTKIPWYLRSRLAEAYLGFLSGIDPNQSDEERQHVKYNIVLSEPDLCENMVNWMLPLANFNDINNMNPNSNDYKILNQWGPKDIFVPPLWWTNGTTMWIKSICMVLMDLYGQCKILHGGTDYSHNDYGYMNIIKSMLYGQDEMFQNYYSDEEIEEEEMSCDDGRSAITLVIKASISKYINLPCPYNISDIDDLETINHNGRCVFIVKTKTNMYSDITKYLTRFNNV